MNRSLLLALVMVIPGLARADVPSPLDPDESCTIEEQCPGVGDERFDNPGMGDHVERELRERGLVRRCERRVSAGRNGGVTTMVVYCPPGAGGCGCAAPGSSARTGAPWLALVVALFVRRRRPEA